MRHPALLPVVWGPGWKGWDPSKSVSANVNGKWGGCGYFDVMWTFAWLLKSASSSRALKAHACKCKAMRKLATRETNPPAAHAPLMCSVEEDPLMDAPGCETLFIHQLGDCHDGTPDGSCMQVRRETADQP